MTIGGNENSIQKGSAGAGFASLRKPTSVCFAKDMGDGLKARLSDYGFSYHFPEPLSHGNMAHP